MNLHVIYVFLVLLKISKEMIKEYFSKNIAFLMKHNYSSGLGLGFILNEVGRVGVSPDYLRIVETELFNFLLCPFLQC